VFPYCWTSALEDDLVGPYVDKPTEEADETGDSQLLLELIQAIDTEHPKDFVDLVCSARDTLPSTIEQELMAIIEAL
jgi:hypothetical protein